MKRNTTIILLILTLISVLYVVKKNSISKSGFNLIVEIEMVDMLQDNNNRLEAELNGKAYKTRGFYDYYTTKFGKDICNDSKKLEKLVREDLEKDYWFIY